MKHQNRAAASSSTDHMHADWKICVQNVTIRENSPGQLCYESFCGGFRKIRKFWKFSGKFRGRTTSALSRTKPHICAHERNLKKCTFWFYLDAQFVQDSACVWLLWHWIMRILMFSEWSICGSSAFWVSKHVSWSIVFIPPTHLWKECQGLLLMTHRHLESASLKPKLKILAYACVLGYMCNRDFMCNV